MMKQLTRAVLRHKRLVALSWIALTLIGMVAAGPASEALDQRFSVPDREGWETSQEILAKYGNGGESPPLVPVVAFADGTTADSPGGPPPRVPPEFGGGERADGCAVV